MSKRIDISGSRFGRLIVKSFAEVRKGHAYWTCICDCGTEKTIAATSLNKGVAQSCGCLYAESRKALGLFKLKDMTGQRFGKLIVLHRAPAPPHVKQQNKAYWLCQCDCGKASVIGGDALRNAKTRSCGCSHWKGGRKVDKQGYSWIWLPMHPKTVGGYVAEHRLIMERHVGRPLFTGETVHHKNGDKQDNRIENLELRVGNHGKGQRVEDLVTWAKELLARYVPRNETLTIKDIQHT